MHQIHATVLAGTKLAEGAATAAGGQGVGWGTGAAAAGPACSGQAYFVTDGRPCSMQAFVDDVLQGLGTGRSVCDNVRSLGCFVCGLLAVLGGAGGVILCRGIIA